MQPLDLQPGSALIHSPARGGWLYFRGPAVVLQAHSLAEILPLFHEIERLQAARGLYAAGYTAYEAGPAFDAALAAKPGSSIPYAWFGLYPAPELVKALPEPAAVPPVMKPGGSLQTLEIDPNTGLPKQISAWAATITRPEYDHAIAAVKDHIVRGHIYQVNYTFRLHSAYQGDAFQTFLWLARAQRAQYAAYIDAGSFALCSASPELFFTLHGDILPPAR